MDFDNKNQAGGMNDLPGVPYEDDSPEEIIIEEAESDNVIETSFTAAEEPLAPRPVNIHSANEYIYNNSSEPESSHQSKGGKIALGVIAAVLAVFVVSVTSISAYIAVTENRTQPSRQPNGSNLSMFPSKPSESGEVTTPAANDTKDDILPDENQPTENHPANVSSQRSYPSLEQLAAPEDAMGLPDIYESEGFDRETMAMPEGHIRLIETVAAANPNTVVVLFCGCAVEMPWLDKVKAVLYMGLPGQAGGAAAANLLTGKANPSGKLTETWPLCYDDVPSRDTFGKKTTHYKEGLYAGYRYYDKAGKAVRFPFGYGLSYTQFAYSDLKIEGRTVTAAVTNTGCTAGAEVVQLYVAPPKNGLYRPAKELKGFAKVSLQPGESRTVRFELNDRSFAVWCDGCWKVPMGSYEICVGASVADIRLHTALAVDGVSLAAPDWQKGSWYETLQGLPTDAEFEKLCGSPLQSDPEPKKGAFTMEHSTMELKDISAVMMQMFKGTEATIAKSFGGKADYSDPTFKMMVMSGADAPLRAAVLSSCGMFPANLAEGMLALANGHPLNGVKKLIKK